MSQSELKIELVLNTFLTMSDDMTKPTGRNYQWTQPTGEHASPAFATFGEAQQWIAEYNAKRIPS
jgi:hypothetical protein